MIKNYYVGDLVVYRGIIGRIENISKCYNGISQYHLVSIDDEEMTATVTGEEEFQHIDSLEDGENVDLTAPLGVRAKFKK